MIITVNKTPLNENVVYKVRDIANKMALLDREVQYLVNKAKIWQAKQTVPPPVNKTRTEEDKSKSKENESESQAETPKETETTEKEEVTLEEAAVEDKEANTHNEL